MTFLPHVLGYIGVLCLVLSFQVNDKSKIMFVQAVGRLFFICQYVLLTAYEGALQNMMCMVCAIVFMNRDCMEAKNRKWLIIINLFVVIFGIILWKNWFSLFAMLGAILQNAAFAMKKSRIVRILTAICIPFWFVYNFASSSYAGMTSDLLTFASVITGIVRFDVLKQPEASAD